MRKGLVRAVGLVAVAALMGGAFLAGSVSGVRAAGSQDVVYIATGENFPDALGAGPVAALTNAPVLLVSRDAIPAATLAELNRLEPETLVIVGGTAVVSQAVADALAALSFSPTVERLAGTDRYATAAAISESRFPAALDADTLNGLSSTDFVRESDLFLPIAMGSDFDGEVVVTSDPVVLLSPYIRAPRPHGKLVINSSVTVREITAGDGVRCAITINDTTPEVGEYRQYWRSPGGLGNHAQLSGTMFVPVGGDQGLTVYLICKHDGGGSVDSAVLDGNLSLVWAP